MADEPVLVVDSGAQKGASVRMPRGENRVGGDPNCAVVVADPALETDQLCVIVDDGVRIRSDCGLVLADGTTVEPGKVFDVPSGQPCSFTAGGTTFRLKLPHTSPEVVAETSTAFSRSWWSMTAGAVMLGVASVIGGVVPAMMPRRPAVATAPAQPAPAEARMADAAASFLRQQSDGAGLSAIVVSPQPDGSIVVGGVLDPGRRPAWAAIREQYDRRFGAERVVVEHFDAPGSLPPLHVAAVWTGPNPYVVDDHGARLGPGAMVGEGWSIAEIGRESIVVRKGERTVALRY